MRRILPAASSPGRPLAYRRRRERRAFFRWKTVFRPPENALGFACRATDCGACQGSSLMRPIILRQMTRRVLGVLSHAGLASLLIFDPVAAETQRRTVNVYNWSDYIDPSVIGDFTKATGIAVRYDTFDSNDVLEAKLLAGRTGYDVVAPTAYFLERQIKAGVFARLDKPKLPNLANMWPEITQRLAQYDPGNLYGVNYMWGTTGIGYNRKRSRELLGG